MSYCTNCGTELNDSAKFCKSCGGKVISSTPTQTSPQKTGNKKNNLFRNIVIGSLILIVGIIIIKTTSTNNGTRGNPYKRIEIDQQVSNYVDNNLLVQRCEFSEELKVQIKKILSDKNPDPKNINGISCGTHSHPCKLCGDPIKQNTIYITKQEKIENTLKDPENNLGIGTISMIDDNWDQDKNNNGFLDLLSSLYNIWTQDLKNEIKAEFEMLCTDFETGDKYDCVIDGDRLSFCSIRCRNNYEYYD